MLALSRPPLDLGPLALVALVPLLWAWRGAGVRWSGVYGGVAGLVFFGVFVSWTRFFGVVAYVPFVVALSLWWVLVGAVAGGLSRAGAAPAPVLAAIWVLAEAGRGLWPLGGFSWGEVGYAFHDVAVARSLAAWGGVLLVSFAAVTVNALVLDGLVALRRATSDERRAVRRSAAGIAAVVAAALVAHLALPGPASTGRLRVALVQGNDLDRDLTKAEARARYLPRNHFRLAAGITAPVDLIVLPESSLDADPRQDPFLDGGLTDMARAHDAAVLAGGNIEAPGGRLFNATHFYRPTGRTPDLYRKRHLVPFGEFVPWREALSFIAALQGVPRDFAPGPGPTVFRVAGHRVGMLICFESAFAPLARQYARRGADIIVVGTNNASYRHSAHAAQHLAISQFRAAETGRPVLQAAISGITGVIDASGRVHQQTGLFTPTVVVTEVTTTRGRTPYVAVGDWILAVAGMIVVAATVGALSRRRSPSGPSDPG